MPHSTHSSRTSAPCRLEWRPSRWLTNGLVALAICAALAVLASEMPRVAAWPLAIAALTHGLAIARRERMRPPRSIVIAEAVSTVDDRPITALQVRWRGSLAFMQWRDVSGKTQRLAFWPDVLPAASRRELRLAAPVAVAARPPASMAP